jgi:hypothetical protein
MKKVYLFAGMFLAGGVAFGQVAQKKSFPIKHQTIQKNFEERIIPSNASGNRATVVSDDFSNASNWTIATAGQGTFQILTTSPTDQAQYMGAMASTTAANGFATFNGVQYLVAANVDPQSTTVTYGSAIDLSSFPAITVDFQQRYRPFNTDQTFLEVSTDGTNWTSFEQNTQYAVNSSAVQNTISQNVSTAIGGSATAYVRFRWENTSDDNQYGSGYGWYIDDFAINTAPDDNLVLSSFRYYDAASVSTWGDEIQYSRLPVSQLDEVTFAGVIVNQGAQTQNNVRLSVDVENSVPTSVYTGNGANTTLASLGQTESYVTTGFTPAAAAESFTATFTANFDNLATDASPANNEGTSSFAVTSNEYGRDDNVFTSGGLWNGTGNSYVMANLFEAKSGMNINRVRAAFTGSTDAGVVACAQIYEVDNTTGDFVLVAENCGTSDEITLSASQISSGSTITWVDFVVCHTLTAGNFYLAAISHSGGTEDLVIMSSPNYTADTTTVFLLDGTDATWYYMTSIPKIRMVEGACDINVAEEEASFFVGQNVPNPVNGNSVISYAINATSEVNFEIVDMTGKVIISDNLGTRAAGDYQIHLDGSKFAPGIYFYSIIVNGERVTKRMVIK